MRKEIRLLVEGFFDDDIFNSNDINQDIQDIGDQYYNYHVGDIYYENNKPYAICCGESKYFMDKTPRFLLILPGYYKKCWHKYNKFIPQLKRHNYIPQPQNLYENKTILHIDENGYENTQIIKNNYRGNRLSSLQAFELCLKYGDNVYLPAIDEIQTLFLNRDIIYNYFYQLKVIKLSKFIWSSTQNYTDTALSLFNTNINKICSLLPYKKNESCLILPFIKIDN